MISASPPDVRRGLAAPETDKRKRAAPIVRVLRFTHVSDESNFPLFYYLTRKKMHLMTKRFLISHDTPALYITIVTKDRLPVFRTEQMKRVLCRALDEARQSAGILLFAYVIMIEHLHLLTDTPSTTSNVLRVIKGLTARRVIDSLKVNNHAASLAKLRHQPRARNHSHSLWQTEKNVLPIFSEGMFMEKVNYIHQNPVRAGFVQRATDYRWSSARIWQSGPYEEEPLLMDHDVIYWRRSIRAR